MSGIVSELHEQIMKAEISIGTEVEPAVDPGHFFGKTFPSATGTLDGGQTSTGSGDEKGWSSAA